MLDPYDADLTEQQASGAALASLHYAYPITVFSYYMVSSTIAICTLQTSSSEEAHPRRRIIKWLLLFCVLSYLVQLLAMLVEAITQKTFDLEQDVIINLLSCILVFGLEFAGLSDSPKVVWHPIIGSIGLALVFEPIIECLSMLSRPSESILPAEFLDIGIVSVRYLAFALATVFYFEGGWNAKKEKGTDSERQGLLGADGQSGDENGSKADQANEQQNGYGTNASSTTESSGEGNQTATTERPESPWERRQREAREQMEKRLKEKGNWFTYAKSFLVFLPYIWPVNNKSLQVRIGLVGICLLTMNFVNVLIPRQLGILMDSLGGINDKNPWTQVLIFGGLKLVASEAGISLLRQWLWIPVEYYSYDAMSTAAYSHVLNLSSDFHDSKSSSDIMMAINSGQSISNMLDSLCFRAIPMLIDMVVAFIYLSVTFGPYEGFITIATSVIFMYIATSMIARLKMARKGEVSAWFEEHYIRQAGIQGWTTVTCFNQIGHEEKRYSAAVKNRITKSQKVQLGYILSYAFQFLVLLCGLLAGAFLAVYQVTHGPATPGQFIMLLTYWAQLVAPLGFFAGLGKSISRDLIGAEQLLEIMQTKPSIVDKEGAPPLEFTGGQVQFDQVCFSYDDKKEILKNVSFTATPGMTVAFVGATGAGKSTILKLLDRFYDVTKGAILIDGQDIRDVSLSSLRTQIGVVPQAPVLFDDTVMNNVRYAKLDATDEEVFEACKAASIHEQILGFTDGYQTRVGERGIKLSGGELQRVAIARAILKKPAIVLLDEATSAVDTETEQRIQDALKQLCEGRTTFIVAHRLSTIMNADRIMVVTGGELVEEGSHEELIRANGKYAELWSRQIFVKPQDGSSSSSAAAEDNNNNNNKNKPANKDEEEEGGHGLVNDLPTEVAELELAKVKVNKKQQQQQQQQEEEATTATDAGAGSDDSDDSTSSSGDSEDSTDTLVTPGNKKEEGSRLNPGAPTFTPRSSLGTLGMNAVSVGMPTLTPTRPGRAGRGCEGGGGARGMVVGGPAPLYLGGSSPIIMVPQPQSQPLPQVYPVFEHPPPLPPLPMEPEPEPAAAAGVREAGRGRSELLLSEDEDDCGAGDGDDVADGSEVEVEYKRPCYSRRAQSKSEPLGQSGL